MKTFEFTGSGSEYFKIWIVNVLLTIVTLGIYYPWARVRSNRYLYGNSSMEGKNFDYHATGKQLLLGYIIAIVGIVIYKLLESFFPIATIPLLIIFILIIPWIILSSLKFNLNVTSFNNVHFKFTGGIKESYLIYLGLPIIFIAMIGLVAFFIIQFKESPITIGVIILLGIVMYIISIAYFTLVKTRYMINYTKYGNSELETKLNTSCFIKIILKTFLLSIFIFIIGSLLIAGISYLFVNVSEVSTTYNTYSDDPQTAIMMVMMMLSPILIISYLFMIVISLISVSYYFTRQRAYIFENIQMDGEVEFFSNMKFIPYSFILISNLLLIIFTLGLAYPWTKVRVVKYTLSNTSILMSRDFEGYISEKQKEKSGLGDQIGDTLGVDIGIPI